MQNRSKRIELWNTIVKRTLEVSENWGIPMCVILRLNRLGVQARYQRRWFLRKYKKAGLLALDLFLTQVSGEVVFFSNDGFIYYTQNTGPSNVQLEVLELLSKSAVCAQRRGLGGTYE